MRYIPNTRLQEGMILAKPFYGSKFEILLGVGMTLGAIHLRRIDELGYAGVYVEDEASAGVAPRETIPDDLRVRTIRAVKDILQTAERAEPGPNADIKIPRERQQKIIMPVMEALIANPCRLADQIDLKPFGDYTYYHAANVVVLSLLVGVEMGISGTSLFELGMAALLHDIGNAFVPKDILDKPGRLTKEEFEIMKSHSQKGFDYLREQFDVSIEACMGALQHHENYDGSGYPNGLRGDKISVHARIIALTDVFDALTSRRPFRQPVYPAVAIDFMNANAGAMFDPEILRVFESVVSLYPAGVCVELDSGAHCLVTENYPRDTSRPKLRLLDDASVPPLEIDLHGDPACHDVNVMEIIEY